MIFKTEDTMLMYRNGQSVTITDTITEPNDDFDIESLPVHQIEFPDGHRIYAWFDEIEN